MAMMKTKSVVLCHVHLGALDLHDLYRDMGDRVRVLEIRLVSMESCQSLTGLEIIGVSFTMTTSLV